MMLSTTPRRNTPESGRWRRAGETVGAALFWLFVWQAASVAVGQELLLPGPGLVARTAIDMVSTGGFWLATGLSLARVTVGFLLAVVLGVALAALTVRFRVAAVLLLPLLRLMRAVPVASFILLALVWIRTDWLPVFIVVCMVTPVVWSNVEQGIREQDVRLLEMAAVFHLSTWATLWQVRVPSVMPYFMAACTTGWGFAWKSGIAAEVICRPDWSMGGRMQDAKMYLETPEVFVWTLAAVGISIALEKGMQALASHGRKEVRHGHRS